MNNSKRARSASFICGALAAFTAVAIGAPAPSSAPLLAETSDVTTLPAAGPHRVFVMSGFDAAPGTSILDADSDELRTQGTVPVAMYGSMALSRDAERIFVLETFYSRGNRGTREDVLAVYDGRTLNLLKDIVLPGRLVVVPKPAIFDVSEDGRLVYVYDMLPASGVHVVDVEQGKVVTTVDLPGCALAYPYGARGFASICGDGTVAAVQVPETGDAKAVFSKPFFDANLDPLFEASVIDKTSAQAWFLSFSGKIFPVRFGDAPAMGKPWSLSVAAGLPPVGTGVQELAWRPGGSGHVMALHRASKRLFVLMHTGNHWTHKVPGTEVWVFDTDRQALVRRIMLGAPAQSIAVSQDASPQLYVLGKEGEFAVMDATTGETLRKRRLSGQMAWAPGS